MLRAHWSCSRWQPGQLQSWNWTLFLWNLVHWTSPCLLFSTLAFPNIHLMTENTKASTCSFQPCSANICHAAFIADYCQPAPRLRSTDSLLVFSSRTTHTLTSHQIFKPEILSKSRVKKQRPFSKGVTLSFSCWQSCSETVKKTRASFNHGTTHSTLWTWLTSYRWLPNSLERKKSSFTQNSTKAELNRPPFSPKGSERLYD